MQTSAASTQFDKRDTVRYCILWLGTVAVILLLTVPHIMSAFTEIRMTTVIGGYQSAVGALSETKLQQMKDDAEEYNRELYEEQKRTQFVYKGAAAANADTRYNSLLRPSKSLDTMCSLSIPKISLNLPVAHGTNGDELFYELGHMYGSSLPWGGENTHSVIAGHSGLKSADLFTYLNRIEEGDKFYIYVLDEVHEYTVDEIDVVLPEEEAPYLQVVDGEDYCTLYTCTPIGVNSHRLLVRGTRTGTEKLDMSDGSNARGDKIRLDALLKFLLWLLIPLAVFLIGLIRLIKKKKAAKKAEKAEAEKAAENAEENKDQELSDTQSAKGEEDHAKE